MYENPRKFFFREVGALFFSIFAVIFALFAVGTQVPLFMIIGLLFILASFVLLITMVVISIVFIFKHIRDKDKKNFPLNHLFNLGFSIFVFLLTSYFYFLIIAGIFVVLAPLLGLQE